MKKFTLFMILLFVLSSFVVSAPSFIYDDGSSGGTSSPCVNGGSACYSNGYSCCGYTNCLYYDSADNPPGCSDCPSNPCVIEPGCTVYSVGTCCGLNAVGSASGCNCKSGYTKAPACLNLAYTYQDYCCKADQCLAWTGSGSA